MVSPNRSLPRCVFLVWLLALIALPLVSGCASNKGLRPMEGTADEANTIAKEGKHLVAVRLLTPTFSQNTENLPTFSIAIAARQAERLARRTRQDGEQTARYFAEQAEMSLPPDLQPHIRANYSEIAKMERALRATVPARHFPSVSEDQWKEVAWILTPIRVPAGETVHRRLKHSLG